MLTIFGISISSLTIVANATGVPIEYNAITILFKMVTCCYH